MKKKKFLKVLFTLAIILFLHSSFSTSYACSYFIPKNSCHYDYFLSSIGLERSTLNVDDLYQKEIIDCLICGNDVLRKAIDNVNDSFGDKESARTLIQQKFRVTASKHRELFHWGFYPDNYKGLPFITNSTGMLIKHNRRTDFIEYVLQLWNERRKTVFESFSLFSEEEYQALSTFFYDLHILADYSTISYEQKRCLLPIYYLMQEMNNQALIPFLGGSNPLSAKLELEIQSLPKSHTGDEQNNHTEIAKRQINTILYFFPRLFWSRMKDINRIQSIPENVRTYRINESWYLVHR